jgi:hypothetical protein
LRNNSCINAPANESEAPTANADKARGNRNCQKISFAPEGIKQPVPPHKMLISMKAGAAISSKSNVGFTRFIELPLQIA